MEGKSVCFFKLISEVLGKETSCDLSELVDIYMVKHPINPLSGMELGLGFLFVPIVCVVPTVFVSPSFLVSPIIVDCLMLFFRYYIGDLQRVRDGKRNDCVVLVKVNVDRLTCGYCLADKECKEQEDDCEQAAKGNEICTGSYGFMDGASGLFLEMARCLQDAVIGGIRCVRFTRFAFGKRCNVRLEALLLIQC